MVFAWKSETQLIFCLKTPQSTLVNFARGVFALSGTGTSTGQIKQLIPITAHLWEFFLRLENGRPSHFSGPVAGPFAECEYTSSQHSLWMLHKKSCVFPKFILFFHT